MKIRDFVESLSPNQKKILFMELVKSLSPNQRKKLIHILEANNDNLEDNDNVNNSNDWKDEELEEEVHEYKVGWRDDI